MRGLWQLLRTTFIGGILFLLPFIVLLIILGKAFDIALRAVKPIITILPDWVSSPTVSAVLAIALVGLFCFLAGLIARGRLAQTMMRRVESAVLSKVPVYTYLKQASARVLGVGQIDKQPVVLAQVCGAWRLGIQTNVAEGGYVAVFFPNSPNSFSGSVFFMTSDQIRPANMPLVEAIDCLQRCGAGSEAVLCALSVRTAGR